MNTDKIKDKIRKLLNLANDAGAFEGEIDNAMRFARRLMLEHNISEGDLGQPKDAHEEAASIEYGQCHAYTQGETMSAWEGVLAVAVERLIGTIGSFQDRKSGVVNKRTAIGTLEFDAKGNPKRSSLIQFYGPAEDVRDATEIFSEWSHIIASMARLKFGGCMRGDGRSYAIGFAAALQHKVGAIISEEKRLIAESGSKALVVRSANELMAAKREGARNWLEEQNGTKLKGSRKISANADSGAYKAGVSDGSRADFSRQKALRIGGSR